MGLPIRGLSSTGFEISVAFITKGDGGEKALCELDGMMHGGYGLNVATGDCYGMVIRLRPIEDIPKRKAYATKTAASWRDLDTSSLAATVFLLSKAKSSVNVLRSLRQRKLVPNASSPSPFVALEPGRLNSLTL